jgi:hypothetical protein
MIKHEMKVFVEALSKQRKFFVGFAQFTVLLINFDFCYIKLIDTSQSSELFHLCQGFFGDQSTEIITIILEMAIVSTVVPVI